MKRLSVVVLATCSVVAALTMLWPIVLARATAQEEVRTADGKRLTLQEYPLPAGAYPHDAVPDRTGRYVWYSGQQSGTVGRVDPTNGDVVVVKLPDGAAPHGIIIGPDDGI